MTAVAGARSTVVPLAAMAVLVLAAAGTLGSIAAGSPLIAAGIAVAGVLALAVMIRPDNATLIVIFVMYSNAAVVAVTFHGAPLLVAAAVPLLLGIPIAYAILIRREPLIIVPAVPWILALLVVQSLGVLIARDTTDAFSEVTAFVTEGVLLFLLVTNAVRTVAQLRHVVWVLLLVGAFLGGLSLLKEATGTQNNSYFGFAQTEATFSTGETLSGETRQGRQAGPVGEKNRYAQIMLMLVPIGLFQFRSERRLPLKAAALGASMLALVGTALTFSRGAAVGFALVILIMTVLRYIRLSQLAFVALAIAALFVVLPQYGARIASLEGIVGVFEEDASGSGVDNSVVSRATTGLAAFGVFADHPILGVGPGQFSSYYREYAAEIGQSVRAEDREAHNLYLGVAADTGILGFVCFIGLLVGTMIQLARARRRWLVDRPEVANLATGFMLALITYATTGLFLHLSYARYFWLMLALGAAVAYIALHLPRDSRANAPA